MAEAKLKTASVLAFERKLSVSDGFMYAGKWEDQSSAESWLPVSVEQKDVRGVISYRPKNTITSDEAKLDAEIQKANLQTVDTASLPENKDTLNLRFTLRVLGDLKTPSVCNDSLYQEKLESVIQSYIDEHQFDELSKRFAENLANGRFLWRNRVGAESITVQVERVVNQEAKESWQFENVESANMRSFSNDSDKLASLADVIKQGFLGDSFVLLKISAYARLGDAQEVFPSQELLLDSAGEQDKSKHLYSVNKVGAMHSQKLGNALRTIDTWYPEGENLGPIAVEPYGSVTSRGKAYRQPKQKMDFYSLLDGWVLKDKVPDVEQQHYVMAMLIRGGVFGEKS